MTRAEDVTSIPEIDGPKRLHTTNQLSEISFGAGHVKAVYAKFFQLFAISRSLIQNQLDGAPVTP